MLGWGKVSSPAPTPSQGLPTLSCLQSAVPAAVPPTPPEVRPPHPRAAAHGARNRALAAGTALSGPDPRRTHPRARPSPGPPRRAGAGCAEGSGSRDAGGVRTGGRQRARRRAAAVRVGRAGGRCQGPEAGVCWARRQSAPASCTRAGAGRRPDCHQPGFSERDGSHCPEGSGCV